MRALGFALLLLGSLGCARRPGSEQAPPRRVSSGPRLKALREREAALRNGYDPASSAPWLDRSGSDPYRLAKRPGRGGFVGILRGSKALVTLDDELDELGRVALPEAPSALCVSGDTAFVGSRYGSELWRVSLSDDAPKLQARLSLEAGAIADVACGDRGLVYVLPADGSSLLTLDAAGHVLDRKPALSGGLRLLGAAGYLLESSLFERSVRIWELDERGWPARVRGRIQHDGPLWALDAAALGPELWIAVAGAEDKPLLRAHGEFENIDSFVWLYHLGRELKQLWSVNVGEQGLVVPKAIGFSHGADASTLQVLAAGSARLLRIGTRGDALEMAGATSEPAPPGAADAVFDHRGVFYPSPLLDAWVHIGPRGTRIVRVDPNSRPEPRVRLGEALFFTDLMAPRNSSTGPHSRFSCETCHFEGGVDGRLHYTGRGDVSVVTKPLFGLANNRPHFSRALDRDLSSVSHNEFRVAGAGSGTDPWSSLDTADHPWLHELGIDAGQLSALDLREALLEFLYAFSHAPNPRAQGRSQLTQQESRGAALFRDHCAGCHAPRLFSDDASSAVRFEAWPASILSRNGPLVWARGEYEKTGVLPYVHAQGTRVPSLRRLWLKPRYFTNGSAPSLSAVVAEFRDGPSGALHVAPQGSSLRALDAAQQSALLAFLQLL